MDEPRFDGWTRRRFGLATGSLASTLLGWEIARVPHTASARKRKKKLKRNAFGCVDVGKPCRGNDRHCCSGRCAGKKPKKGKPDKSRCVAHHVGVCTPGLDDCVSEAGTACNPDLPFAVCYRTTGGASFCGNAAHGGCIACRKDAECEEIGFPKGTACVVCLSCEGGEGTACITPGTA